MSKNIMGLIEDIKSAPGFEIWAPQGLPQTEPGYNLPEDVRLFYTACGGVNFSDDNGGIISIVSPTEFRLANPVIMGEEIAASKENDISNYWYIIAHDGDLQWITIDLHPDRIGHCYDSFWDRHAFPGTSDIIAYSFTAFVESIINMRNSNFWLLPEFKSLGDAYNP